MTKPVICILDGKTYEYSAIKEWLEKHGTSPITRNPMKQNQSIDDVLIENRNLEEMIEQFRGAHLSAVGYTK